MITSPSALLRDALESVFAASFNANLSDACLARSVGDLAYNINFGADALPQNYYRTNQSVDSVEQKDEPDFPAMCMWVGTWADAGSSPNSPKPTSFFGPVTAYWRFWLYIPGRLKSVRERLVPLREATESALITTLQGMTQDPTPRRDLTCQSISEGQWTDMAQQQVGWLQEVEYTATFEVQL